jgi:phosphopantothenoylcysteine decarboxylase/phosphopantothenate--cysteine ligase
MKLLVTAGPTREPIDAVRFITNASSGQMGYAVAAAGVAAGMEVTLLSGPVALAAPAGCEIVHFITVADLKGSLESRFTGCDALVMAAAVGDFAVRKTAEGKLHRAAGPVTVTLVPTEDLLGGLAARKRPGQRIVAFAVEEPPPDRAQAAAAGKLAPKGADFIVVNTPAAMAADTSEAAILSPTGVVLPWARRPKTDLARQIIRLLVPSAAR